MINKYGEEEGIKKFESYVEKHKIVGNTLDYFINKYGEEEGIKKYKDVCFLKGHTIDSYIIRYNNEEMAYFKYNEFLSKVSCNSSSTSNIALELFNNIYSILPKELTTKTYFNDNFNNKEFIINDYLNKKCYMYDFVISSLKICFEFNGDYWHANPILFKETDVIRGKKVLDIWQYDYEKINVIKNSGYDVYIIWENEYLKDKEYIIKFLLDKILEKANSQCK
jgi:very-short-patch-repair endonuclease